MNKRDVKIYDNSWQNILEHRTEYDVEIIASIIDRYEWRQLMTLEKDFDERFPMFKFNYHLIESDPKSVSNNEEAAGKLIYDAESITKIQE